MPHLALFGTGLLCIAGLTLELLPRRIGTTAPGLPSWLGGLGITLVGFAVVLAIFQS